MQYFSLLILALIFLLPSCNDSKMAADSSQNTHIAQDSTQYEFWKNLSSLCGQSFEGSIVAGPPNDTLFENKRLLMHVRTCGENVIKIPFFVGNDSSRTWVFTRTNDKISLKHDHRHEDGTPDEVTMYGGNSSHSGSSNLQYFPADQETADIIPAAMGNIWWIEIINEKSFSYNLRRVNTDRYFSVSFDLSKPVDNPGAPWGWDEN